MLGPASHEVSDHQDDEWQEPAKVSSRCPPETNALALRVHNSERQRQFSWRSAEVGRLKERVVQPDQQNFDQNDSWVDACDRLEDRIGNAQNKAVN